MKNTILLFILSAPSVLSLAQDTITGNLKKEATTFINSEMKSKKVTGLSVALVRNDSIVWAEGFGYSDLKPAKKCNDSTLFRVGSVSKLFTATAIMQLAEQDKLSLDAPVVDIIPEFSIGSGGYDIREVTIRRILTHKSGLPSDVFRGLFNFKPDPIDSIIRYLKNENLTNKPGTVWSYSNPGYTLLGYIVQRVSGMPFEEYMEKYVLDPLDMNSSSFTLNESNKKLFSDGFEKGKTYDEPPLFELPAGLLHSNVTDISHFIIMVMNGGRYRGNVILKPETLKEMFEIQQPDNKLDFSMKMGLCWFLHGKDSEWGYAGGSVEHRGDTYVFHTQLTILPEMKTGVIVLTNSDRGASAARSISNKILKLSAEKYDGKKAPEEKDKEIEFIKSDKKTLSELSGGYTLGPDYLKIRMGKNKLLTKQSGLTLCFIPNNLGTYTPAVRILGFIRIPIKKQQVFFKEIDGKMYLAAINKKDTMLAGAREKLPEILSEWKKMEGLYEGIGVHDFSLFKKINLKESDGILKAECTGWKNSGKLTLIVKNKTEAVVCGVGRQTGNVLKIEGDKLYFSGIYYKRVK